jgi:putative ABC transport system permease protein
MLEGRPHYVVGVMPPQFRFPSEDTEVWAAMKNNMSGMPRNGRFMVTVGRLEPGVSLASAQAELDAVETQLDAAYPDTNHGWRVRLTTIQDATVGETKPALLTLIAAVGFVLLIACANVANLLLARATSRSRETAIRLALGASRRRIVAQWLTENLVLSLTGGVIGVALAYAVAKLIVVAGPPGVPRLDETAVDTAVLGFTLVVSLIAGILPAMLPALRAARSSTSASLKDGVGGYSTTGRNRAGAVLIVCEVALAMTLAVAGALLLKSYAQLIAVRPGFDAAGVLSLKVFLAPPRYRTVAQSKQYITSALERIARIPGVDSVAAISQVPISDPSSTQFFEAEDRPTAPGDRPAAGYRAVSASYFATMRIPIVRGRALTENDRIDTPLVVVINEATARRVWPNANPIGKRIKWATGVPQFDAQWHTVVGVAADVKSNGLDKPEAPAIYAPYEQRSFPWLRWSGFVMRTQGSPDAYTRLVRQELASVDPMQPIYDVRSLDDVIAQSTSTRRFHTGLIDLFAALALGLAAIGVYGTIGYWVTERAREIGVRMALGADAKRVALMIVGRAGALTAVGIVFGLLLSAATSRLLTSMLFNVEPFDPATVTAVAALVSLVAIGGAYVPARRASRLDPLTVIRGE